MSYPFGKMGSTFVLVNMLVLAYGAMVAYLLIIKDTIPTILGIAHGNNGGLLERNLIMLVTSLFVILPLAVQRDMASLSGTSLVSVLADVILVLFIAFTAPISESVKQAGGFGEVLKDEWINPTLFIGLGILSTAMACQHSAFIVSGSLKNKTQKRWATVTFRSISTATLLCILLGVCGYLAFLEDTQGDILNNFEKHAIAANIARGLLAVTMFCKFQLVFKVFIKNILIFHFTIQISFNSYVPYGKFCSPSCYPQNILAW
jgi:solute carrier family 38 (sodium-coupled neutral amino acid transporter), member 11